jgi:hypothetical protein
MKLAVHMVHKPHIIHMSFTWMYLEIFVRMANAPRKWLELGVPTLALLAPGIIRHDTHVTAL